MKSNNKAKDFKLIGKRVKRVDAYEKVTGKAIYGDDIKLNKMLYAAVRYTDIPCGKITNIDLKNAERIKGVKSIATYDDIPGQKRLGAIRADHYPLVNDEVFYSGDVIAAVAAETKEAAQEAVDQIRVDYQQMEGIFDPREAFKKEARLIHPEYKSNIMVHYPLRKGKVENGFENSDHIIERTYRTGFHEHAYIEPESITVEPDPMCKGYKVYGSIQNPFTTRKVVALCMGVDLNQVNVIGSTLGGSFGGKDDVVNYMACRCAILAKKTGRPVKLTYSREDSIKESYKRHPYYMNYKAGFDKDGKLKAMKINIIADCGAYSSQTFFVTWRSVVQATGPYEIDNVETDIYGVYTNNTYTAAFRGFGSPQVIFAQESLMDEIASICNISPFEIRKINGYKQNSITASGQKLAEHKVSLQEVMKTATKKSDYQNKIAEFRKLNSENSRFKYGIGLSCSFRGCALGAEGTDATSAIVSVQADGSVYLLTGLNENGQGMRTTFCQIAAEVLGVNTDRVVFVQPQTSTITDGGPTVASRGTIAGGNATIIAAEELKQRIFEVLKTELKAENIDETIWQEGKIINKHDPEIFLDFNTAVEKAYLAGVNLSAYGWWKSPNVSWHEETGQGNAYFTYVYGCHVAQIKLDSSTGKIEVLNITAAHDVGKVINRIGAEGQVTGGVTQGFGYAVLEDYNIQNGEVKSANFDEYLIPTIKDIKNIDLILIENEDPAGPFGAKSLGEPTLELTSAAINNAYFFINKEHSYELPLTLEKVFLNKQLKKPARQSELAIAESCHIHQTKKQSPRIANVSSVTPSSLYEALSLLENDNYEILAGGTDVVIGLRMKSGNHKLMNIFDLKELKGIEVENEKIKIKSGTTFSEILESNIIKTNFPLLIEACSKIGSKQIRNRGTIGGNLANAAPCADSFPPLLVYNAVFSLQSKTKKRVVKAQDFITRNYQTVLKPDEILTEIIIPFPNKKYYVSYFQLGRRNAMNITRLSGAAMISFQNGKVADCRFVTGSLFSKPKRISEVEEFLKGKVLNDETIDNALKPLSDLIEKEIGMRWSSEYKKPVFLNIARDLLLEIREKRNAK
ncbi:MAG: molybdopterin-dependent oxidoreductase [Candidatus Cloacimonetes bacterium]|nr:molybdopterin-dependent oxidoreductase [Candidatus Cloacimonadota bacterium]MCF7815024.1 molybdopterin-dependent oxidoreductase [Candidatus Cloacimonadota bacterium]MCF7869274.1 molybdopterin-dependent oxidoreductase [Candidatus Cloacimonadota bacterium]MCF7884700.1 molybdopterin-dependent oxidoreductase [Candidatus Cloacimonadota bacterium]